MNLISNIWRWIGLVENLYYVLKIQFFLYPEVLKENVKNDKFFFQIQ